MPQPFDLAEWRERVAAWWREHASNWQAEMGRLGVSTAYGLLTASAFLPVWEAVSPADPRPAIDALSLITASVGTNLVANVVQGVYDRRKAAVQMEIEIAEQVEHRAGYQEFLNGLDVLTEAQSALGEQWAAFEGELRGELGKMGGGLHIEAGGAVILGSVQVLHGDFVGRDKIEHHYHYGPQPPDTAPLREAYLRQVVARTERLPLRGLDVAAGDPANLQRPRLDQVYIGLDTTARVGGEELKAAMAGEAIPWSFERDKRRPRVERLIPIEFAGRGGEAEQVLPALVAVACSPFTVLLGDPGSGKSTFVNHLAFCLAQHQLAPDDGWLGRVKGWPTEAGELLPLVITLRDFAVWGKEQKMTDGSAGAIGAFVDGWLADRDLPDFAQPLRDLLTDGKAIIFFDGLDEVLSEERRVFVRDAVADYACTYGQARIVITCRTLSYQEPAQQLPEETFATFELAPFSEPKIEQFIEAWYAELAHLGAVRAEDAPRLTQDLKDAVRRSDIRRMAPNPLLLTVMALLHAHRGHLPGARALVYEECTALLLWRWDEGKAELPGLRRLLGEAELQDVDLERVLWALAFDAQAEGGWDDDGEGDGATADIAEADLLRALRELHPKRSWDWAAAVVDHIQGRAGLLIEREPEVYTFPHRTFQEYLAACHLSVQEDFVQHAAGLVEEAASWREVMLLAVGREVYVRKSPLQPLALVEELCPQECPEDDGVWLRTWRAGEVLEEAGFRRVEQQGKWGRGLLRRVQGRLARLVEDGHLTPRERLEAGDLLGRMDDPRPGVTTRSVGGLEVPDILWVHIPAGPFLMGSSADDTEAYDDEKPRHEVVLPDYYIARYPVTNAQFRPFVEGDGYENADYWTEQGWAWRRGAEADLSVWDDYSDEDVKKNYREWLAGRPAERRDRPFYWGHARWGVPNRPVVGLTWFEAVAYTRWLKRRMADAGAGLRLWRAGEVKEIAIRPQMLEVALPSEAEWEKAARGMQGQTYPWGGEWQADRANTQEAGLEQTSPVGMIPAGHSPYEVSDMSGNVWEWTRSRWGERSVVEADYAYPYEPDDGRERLEEMKIPILRGGSWFLNQRNARCACRNGYGPDNFNNDDGFRVVVSLVGSGF